MKHTASTRIASLLLMLAATVPGWSVEHPGVVPVDSDCASCHAKKISGKSVHSAMSTACTVCHVARTQGDMTTLSLAMPKEQICFACHEKSAELRQHVPVVKGSCLECHDAHSSDQRMLLRSAEGPPASAHKTK
jgi:predicted CXXCH cytochrome family protein